ncbi:hypothetical protein [Nonomuraea sp. B19D2]
MSCRRRCSSPPGAAGIPDEVVREAADALRKVLSHVGRRRYR